MTDSHKSLFFLHDDALQYRFYADHPFDQRRIEMTQDLLFQIGALYPTEQIQAACASLEALQLNHREDYITAVKELSQTIPDPDYLVRTAQYGLDHEDTPYFEGMHEAASAIVGGSIAACEAVMEGKALHALHMAGGLHHAFPDRAAGFCVYNDASIAIASIRKKYGARVLYIDTDVHHGDGVQWSFYTDPEVMTYSIHETGKYLFPGTGFVQERGEGEGFGICVNVPLEPYTEDDSWLSSFRDTIGRAAASFKPDIIVSQHGCDAHALDPLSHMHCSMRIYQEMPAIIHQLAHTYCNGRWVALGGGGYDIWRVVPRAWSLLWLEMIQHPLAAQLRTDPLTPLPAAWLHKWQYKSPTPLPTTWLDDTSDWTPMPRRELIEKQNSHIVTLAQEYIR
ncbi:acetoin utilization protein AcuC [Paenibacillus arenosi]|uniref:Acetoin utilization protein AcuC n=1 Tax=Paenibacillus arenosi TaxID=2774142 RepID=A0ABR9AUF2_9BACL|nr:acetoin utilization protein AcuC [Paenibacillus arenosi]MBD8496835.1 acetoin utilization protein AcuC [Paenibacillus arenosi]